MQHDSRCVGCNLGRTAEFTSKIILAIHGALSVADVARRAWSRRRCGRAELGPGADVAGVSPVPAQMWPTPPPPQGIA
jgi:hypothetical protein